MSKYIYNIKIDFSLNNQPLQQFYHGTSICENGKDDIINITNHGIEVVCGRSSNLELSRVLTDFRSTINMQISKAIAFAAAINCSVHNIKSIEIVKLVNGVQIEESYFPANILQPLKRAIPPNLVINQNTIVPLFNGGKLSNTLHIALTNWLRGLTEDLPGDRFDRLWTSFNSLYSYIFQNSYSHIPNNTEINKLISMRDFISRNQNLFALSINYFDSFDQNDIRNLQWQKMIWMNMITLVKLIISAVLLLGIRIFDLIKFLMKQLFIEKNF